jgi:transposase
MDQLPSRLKKKSAKDGNGNCLHVNRICVDSRDTELFLKRRKYRCDDCDCKFNTVEIAVTGERFTTKGALQDIFKMMMPDMPEIRCKVTALNRALADLQDIFDSE